MEVDGNILQIVWDAQGILDFLNIIITLISYTKVYII
jgi:hypothetical protein